MVQEPAVPRDYDVTNLIIKSGDLDSITRVESVGKWKRAELLFRDVVTFVFIAIFHPPTVERLCVMHAARQFFIRPKREYE